MQIEPYSNGATLASIVVTTVTGHVVAGYGNVNNGDVSSAVMESLGVNNTMPEETKPAQCHDVCRGGRTVPVQRHSTRNPFQLCVSYLAFEPITDPVERGGLGGCLEEMFVSLDYLLKTHIHGIVDSWRQQEGRVAAIAVQDAAKRLHLEHEEQKTHHFKNAFIAMDHILRSTTQQNLEPSTRSAMELTTTGILTCMRTKAFSLLQHGEHQRRSGPAHRAPRQGGGGGTLWTHDAHGRNTAENNIAKSRVKCNEHGRNGGVVGISAFPSACILERCSCVSLMNPANATKPCWKSVTVIQVRPPGHFTHVSITTPIVSALKNYYRLSFLEVPTDILNPCWSLVTVSLLNPPQGVF
jgi:hypothetical protein